MEVTFSERVIPRPTDARLESLAAAWEHPLSSSEQGKLDSFLDLLLVWNARINLTGAQSREELLGEHLADSLAMAALVPIGSDVLDVGSGGGLPALPFAVIRPDSLVSLCEPRMKRVSFLRTAVRELSLRAEVLAVRSESIDRRWAAAGSRATYGPAEWLREGSRLVRPGGRVLVFTTEASQVDAGSPPVASVRYWTMGGRPRWAAAFAV